MCIYNIYIYSCIMLFVHPGRFEKWRDQSILGYIGMSYLEPFFLDIRARNSTWNPYMALAHATAESQLVQTPCPPKSGWFDLGTCATIPKNHCHRWFRDVPIMVPKSVAVPQITPIEGDYFPKRNHLSRGRGRDPCLGLWLCIIYLPAWI